MAKPPDDADPEKFIIGRGSYDNLQMAVPHDDDAVFRIDPAAMPVKSIVVLNCIFIAFFYGFHWVAKYHMDGEAGALGTYWAPIGIGFFTCSMFTGLVYYNFDKARRLGPWLIYHKATGRVELPREKLDFDRAEVLYLQYATTKRLSLGGVMNNDRLSELNLVVLQDGQRKRWPLLRSIFTTGAFDRVLRPLIEQTDLPIKRVTDDWLEWSITETPYRCGDE